MGQRRLSTFPGRLEATDGEGSSPAANDLEEPELATWQKSWVKQNPGRSLSEMPAEEPKFNPDNFDPLSVMTGGVSLIVLAAALWLANTAAELRNLTPEELQARFGDEIDLQSGASVVPPAYLPAPGLQDYM